MEKDYEKMTLYEVNGKPSLCPYCVTLCIGLGLPHQGHNWDCPCAKIQEMYALSQPREASDIFKEILELATAGAE